MYYTYCHEDDLRQPINMLPWMCFYRQLSERFLSIRHNGQRSGEQWLSWYLSDTILTFRLNTQLSIFRFAEVFSWSCPRSQPSSKQFRQLLYSFRRCIWLIMLSGLCLQWCIACIHVDADISSDGCHMKFSSDASWTTMPALQLRAATHKSSLIATAR